MNKRRKKQQYFVPVLAAAVVVSGLSGFGIGRATAGTRVVRTPETAEEGATIIGGADGETSIVIADNAATTEAQAEASTEASDAEAESGAVQGAVSGLIDAADITNIADLISGESDDRYSSIDVGAYSNEDEKDYAEVDPAYVANVTLREAELPDGVASTLWSKNGGEAAMQVVVLGDSQFANFLGEDGMAYKLSQKCQANVYNLAIGGTAASISSQDVDYDSRFDDTGLCGWVKAITGKIDAEKVFGDYTYQYNVFKSCDFSKTDIFILEYGVNDYFMKSPVFSDDDYEEDKDDDNGGKNIRTYNGALEFAVKTLRTNFPDAYVIICAPSYAEFFDSTDSGLLGNYYSLSNGIGTLEKYVNAARNVPTDFQMTTVMVPVDDMDTEMDYDNADEYLIDGVHLTEKGREEYTQILGRFMIRDMGYTIPEDTDPADYDWRSTKED